MTTAIVSEKGWVVIPQEIRKRYNLKKGDKVHFIDYGGVVGIVPASNNPIKDAAGMLKGKGNMLQSLLKAHREEVERDR